MAQKPRILHDGKDMIWTLLPLAAIALFIAAVSGTCSIGHQEGRVPDFNAKAAFEADASNLAFPIRDPEVPDDWQANSGGRTDAGGRSVSQVGWIAGDGSWVQLSQTDADEESLAYRLGGDDLSATGTRELGGHAWVTYRGEKGKKFWITDLGGTRVAVLSEGPDGNLETLARAVAAAEPLPAVRPSS